MTEKTIPNGTRLWDEILKAIVDAMPEQLFPLFKEVYGKEYPKGTGTGTETPGRGAEGAGTEAWKSAETAGGAFQADTGI